MTALRTTLAALCLALPAAAAADAPALDDVHLTVIRRTDAERARIAAVTATTEDFSAPERFEAMPGGAATVRATDNSSAFSLPSANLGPEGEFDFFLGNGLFKKLWVSSPASTKASDGLGPLFNARSCQRCHIKDGRGHPPEGPDDDTTSMFLRVSIPGGPEDAIEGIEGYLATLPEPTYGGQIQDKALPGHEAEARMEIAYEEIPVTLADGTVVSLRKPGYRAADPGYGDFHPEAMFSPRVAPQMIGLGLLEAIPAEEIVTRADPDDADGDGISGRAQIVWSAVHGRPMLGRFGLKAGNATILDQSASAFAGDIGISTPVFPAAHGDCTVNQAVCRDAPHGDGDARGHEIDAEALELVEFYSANLAVPARRDVGDPQVLLGKRVFHETGCASCHTPKHVTARLEGRDEHSFQLIWPYTDLLLHDMGEGLADNRPEARANGREWRTPPLWGIGLTEQVSGHTYFLHDGRARSLLEAILWHGGEAQAARDRVVEMPQEDRAALIRFLESL